MTIKVVSVKILERCDDWGDYRYGKYVSELEVDIGGTRYGSSVVHPADMIDDTYVSSPSQRAYVKYDLVRKIGIEVESQIFKQLNVLT